MKLFAIVLVLLLTACDGSMTPEPEWECQFKVCWGADTTYFSEGRMFVAPNCHVVTYICQE